MPRRSNGYFPEYRTEPQQVTPTPAELAALNAVSRGLTAGMAAEVLGISPYTVQRQLKAARRKLAAKNTTHAVAIAMRQQMIE